MRTLILVSSASQMYFILKLVKQFSLNTSACTILIFSQDDVELYNIRDIIGQHCWYKIIVLKIKKHNNKTLNRIVLGLKIISCITGKKFDTIVASQIESGHYLFCLKVCRYQTVIALDEGFSSHRFVEKRKIDISAERLVIPSKITLYSSFNLAIAAPDKLIKIDTALLIRSSITDDINNEQVAFIGSPFVEDGLMSESSYMKYLSGVIGRYHQYKITYFLHRRETCTKFERFNLITSLSFFKNVGPIEIYFENLNPLPCIVSGFNSAALYNLRKMIPSTLVRFESISLDPNSNSVDSIELMNSIEKTLETNNVFIIKNSLSQIPDRLLTRDQ